MLGKDNPTLGFNRLQSRCAVRRRAGENYANGPLMLVLRQRFKKEVNGSMRPGSRLARLKFQTAFAMAGVGRNDIDVVRLDRQVVRHFAHRKGGLDSRPVSALSRAGSRCCTNTKAMPVSVGKCWSSCVSASKPPADAPIPTTGGPPIGLAILRHVLPLGLSKSATSFS